MKAINFGIDSIRFYGITKMPIAVLKTVNENPQIVGYLSPFRDYCFQVSDTFAGEGDRGSTPVIGLRNILSAKKTESHSTNLNWPETTEYVMKSLATMACVERQGQLFLNPDDADDKETRLRYVDMRARDEKAILSDGRKSVKWYPTMMDIFVLEVLRYLKYEHYEDLTEKAESK